MWYLYVSGSWIETAAPTRAECFGDGAFETIHVWKGHPLFLSEHLRRLRDAAYALSLRLPLPVEELSKVVIEQARLHHHARLKILLYRKGEGTYTPPTTEGQIRIGVTELPPTPFPLGKPQRVVIFPTGFTVATPWSGYKLLSAVSYVQAAAYAQAQAADDAIVLSAEGYLAETSRANLFFWDGEKLCTPALRTGCVRGILRTQVLQAARELHLPIAEGLYTPQALLEAHEAFTTNVIQGIVPILGVRDSGKTYKTGEGSYAAALGEVLLRKLYGT